MDHRAVDRVADIRTARPGYLCNCGRTIIGRPQVDEHFKGEMMTKEDTMHRRLEGFEMWYRQPKNFRTVAFAMLMRALT